VNHPSILLADEPTGNLDPDSAEDILRLLFRINSGGTAVLMATHDHTFVRNFGQRILHLRDGKVLEDQRTGLVGNLGDRLDAVRLERDRQRRVDHEIKRQRASTLSRKPE
jgi:ABC-type methionine transport system ATPase subunit